MNRLLNMTPSRRLSASLMLLARANLEASSTVRVKSWRTRAGTSSSTPRNTALLAERSWPSTTAVFLAMSVELSAWPPQLTWIGR